MPNGITSAIPFALRRGHVMVFVPSILNLGEFLITGNGLFILVSLRFARKFSESIAEIKAEFNEAITGLRLVPRNGPVSCELWLYNRYGTLRHFRIGDTVLVEIDCYGTPLDQVKPVVATGASPISGETPAPHGAAVTGPATYGTAETKDPILRWLAKWNAARKSGGGAVAAGGSELKKILDAGGPGTKPKRKPRKKRMGGKKGPTVPEEKPEPEEPGSGQKPDPGKPATKENPGPDNPVPSGIPPASAGAVPVPGGQKQESISRSTGGSPAAGDTPVPGGGRG